MTSPAERTIRAVAIPRTDPEGHGIHIAWSGPELLALSLDGYEVRRRHIRGREHRLRCATLDRRMLGELETLGFLRDELGAIFCAEGQWPHRLLTSEDEAALIGGVSPDPFSAAGAAAAVFTGRLLSDPRHARADAEIVDAPAHAGQLDRSWEQLLHRHELPGVTSIQDPPKGFGELAPSAIERIVAAAVPSSFAIVDQPVLVFTQELDQPTDRVYVTCESREACAVAISGGKAMGLEPLPNGAQVSLESQAIDTVVVYALAPTSLRICEDLEFDPDLSDSEWDAAEVLARGLTVPLRESETSLPDRAAELSTARGRLITGETLDDREADRIAEALRSAAARTDLGRPCDRVMLSRSSVTDSFQETLFTTRIALLSLDSRWRRVLGLGFADTTAVDGETYEYRVTGRFPAEDLRDDVYDVHNVPSGTALPTVIRIGDLTIGFPAPSRVVLDPAPDPAAVAAVTRRGIALAPVDPLPGWVGADLFAELSCVIELPNATDTVVLEVPPNHDLFYAGGQDGDPYLTPGDPVPAGPHAALHFPAPVTQIRLGGRGTLYAVRLPSGAGGVSRIHRETGEVTMAAEPFPREPFALTAANLQTPAAIITGPIGEQTELPARPQPGFKLTWVPATESPPAVWPEDLAAGPPLQAIAYQIEHRRVYPGVGVDPWDQLQAGDNLTFASWPASDSRPTLEFGADIETVFPLHPLRDPGTSVTMSVTDVFGVVDPETRVARPNPPLGSYHQYRIRAMDIVGRVSAGWTESNRPRLEKHIPPPPPVGPQPPPLPTGNPPRLSGPVGVRARAILASGPDLSVIDSELLAGHDSAVLLDWGWREAERELDPTTTEFRIYVQQRVPTEVPGQITNVASAGGTWTLDYTTDRWLTANECKGQWIKSGSSTFKIMSHTGGATPQITVAASTVDPTAAPVLGPTSFGRPPTAHHRRPGSWTARVGVVPLGTADSYSYLIFDAITVSATDRKRTIWVGVSAADSESYIPDELPAAVANGGRPGNESSIAAVTVNARYLARPTFSVPPPLGDIPELVTDEPTGRQVRVTLDGPALVGAALPAGARVALDRCPADAIMAVTRAIGGNVVMRRASGSTQTVVFPNSGDEATVLAALQSDHPEEIASRYLLFLLGHFDRPDELLQRTGGQLTNLSSLGDDVDPKPGRYFYRVRLGDDAGTVSAGGAILPIVARVPSTAPAPAPRRVSVAVTPASLTLTVEIEPDPELRWVLLFANVTDWTPRAPDPARAQLVRIPNRRDLYPTNGIRLRLADGTLLTPAAKVIADPDVTSTLDGKLRLSIPASIAAPVSPANPPLVQYWCYGLSRDGIPSRPLGPHSSGVAS